MLVTGLFAGIGGLEIGLARAGHSTVAVSEIEPSANAVLRSHVDAPNLGDVRAIASLPSETELLTAGFPCQDLSQAGLTKGIEGDRSGLVGEVFRLLDRSPVDWVLLENVPFMLRLDSGRAMTHLVEAFEARGYRWAYRIVDTLAFLPQRRERVLFLASRVADPADVLLVDDIERATRNTALTAFAHGFYWTEGVRGLGWGQDCIPTLKNGSTIGIPSPPAILLPNGAVVTPDIHDAERLQGFEVGWTEPAASVARASARWALVGNAVSVPVAHWLGSRLARPGAYEPEKDVALGPSWPKAARFDGGARRGVTVGSHPVAGPVEHLHDFLNHPGKPLSARATAGFLTRARRGSLRFRPGFLDALDLHLFRMTMEPALAA